MNGKQKAVLWIGFALILAAGAYPPWIQWWDFVAGGQEMQMKIGPAAGSYSWIHRPPTVPSWVDSEFRRPDDKEITNETTKGFLRSVRMAGLWRARIDTARLAVEWFVILVGVCCAFLTLAGDCALPHETEDRRAAVEEVGRHA